MTKNLMTLIISVFLMLMFSCKKNQLGGKSAVEGYVKHHGKNIPYARVFIKFNAKNFPGNDTMLYDNKVITDANGYFSINFYKGDYYLFGYGEDYSIPAPYTVYGGVQVSLRDNEKRTMDIYVTEP